MTEHDTGTQTGPPLPATAMQTRLALLERSGRAFAPISKTFVQNPDRQGTPDRRGPLASFVQRGDKRGLNAFLLLHSIISSGDHEDGWSTTLHLSVWARALNTVATATASSATSAATKILTRLVGHQLITRQRSGRERQVTVTLLDADGSGQPYTRPKGQEREDRFLRLSHQYWIDQWDESLSLPAIAMLLVILHEKPNAPLPTARVPEWYGWSADTAERGLSELRDKGLLQVTKQVYTEPLSPSGLSSRNHYLVLSPFDADSVNHQAAQLKGKR